MENPFAWEANFPPVYGHTSVSFLKHCPYFWKAKQGDMGAAMATVNVCVKPRQINKIRRKYPTSILLPVITDNKLPQALAMIIGLEIHTGVYEIHSQIRKQMTAVERLLYKPEFAGEIAKGKNYIIVDDIVTQGGTISALRKFVIIYGGFVSAVIALACAPGGSILAPNPENVYLLTRMHSCLAINDLLINYNIAQDVLELTNSQIKYLLRFKSIAQFIEKIELCRGEMAVQCAWQKRRSIMKTLLFSNTYEMCELVREYCKDIFAENNIALELSPGCDGITLYNAICERKPEAVILDFIMCRMDGLSVIQKFREMHQDASSMFFVLSGSANEYMIKKAVELDCKYVFLKPIDFKTFSERIISNMRFEMGKKFASQNGKRENIVSTLMRELGVPCHIKGYKYLCEAVQIALVDDCAIHQMTTKLYPQIAEAYDSTPSRVERAIRNAKTIAWERSNAGIQEVFFYSRGTAEDCPTNAEFIALITEYLLGR